MTCNNCANFSLQADERMARQGYGGCKKAIPGCYFAFKRPKCKDFEEAPADIVAKRVEWMKGSK